MEVHRICVCLFSLLLCLAFVGCGKKTPRFAEDMRPRNPETKTGGNDAGSDAAQQEAQDVRAAVASVNIPAASDELWQKAISSTVRLIVEPEDDRDKSSPFGFGSGVILNKEEDGTIYILTAWHAAEFGIRDVEFFRFGSETPVATYHLPQLVSKSERRDLALLKLKIDAKLNVETVDLVADPDSENTFGYSVGCSLGRTPTVHSERILGDDVIRFAGSVPPRVGRMWITDAAQEQGRSGGALLNGKGQLLGIASASKEDVDRGYYCHAAEIHSYLGNGSLQDHLNQQADVSVTN